MLLSGLILLFFFFRVYLYYNLVFASISFDFYQTFQMFWWGLRFDLCVIGFLLLPVFLVFLLSLILSPSRGQKYLFGLGFGYVIAVFAMTFMVKMVGELNNEREKNNKNLFRFHLSMISNLLQN
jgi:hypothetical protein